MPSEVMARSKAAQTKVLKIKVATGLEGDRSFFEFEDAPTPKQGYAEVDLKRLVEGDGHFHEPELRAAIGVNERYAQLVQFYPIGKRQVWPIKSRLARALLGRVEQFVIDNSAYRIINLPDSVNGKTEREFFMSQGYSPVGSYVIKELPKTRIERIMA